MVSIAFLKRNSKETDGLLSTLGRTFVLIQVSCSPVLEGGGTMEREMGWRVGAAGAQPHQCDKDKVESEGKPLNPQVYLCSYSHLVLKGGS